MFIQHTGVNVRIKLPRGFGDYYCCSTKFANLNLDDPGEAHIARGISSNDWHTILEEMPADKSWRDYDINSQGGRFHKTLEKQKRLLDSGEWKIHPLPDFKSKPIALIGRGRSALGWQDRYPKDKFIRVGINLGVNRERNWMGLNPSDIDLWATCDASALLWACSNFLETYHGPIIAPPSAKDNWIQVGPGTFHGVPATGQSQSLTYALKACKTYGASEVHIVGCDLEDVRVKHRRDNHLHDIRAVENSGVRILIDSKSKFEELKKQHKVT